MVHCTTAKALGMTRTMCPPMKTVVCDTRQRTEVATIQTTGTQQVKKLLTQLFSSQGLL